MSKTVLITGSTDGIGAQTARMLVAEGHRVLLHGRNPAKLEKTRELFASSKVAVECYQADLSRLGEVESLASAILKEHDSLDVLINNAGVFAVAEPVTEDGLDVRFVVNTIAPYLLTQRLLPLFGAQGRVINVSSAAQSPVDLRAMAGGVSLSDGIAYAQSKLALTMWSREMALQRKEQGPAIIAVNPGSMLGSKMVKEAYGVAGSDIRIGADILCRAALTDEFAEATGRYYDNDSRRFAPPHPDALDSQKSQAVIEAVERTLSTFSEA